MPDFRHELQLMERGARRVVGVDEVGRGPLAGPVTAAAVRLDPDCLPDGLDDSKALAAPQRARLAAELAGCAEIAVVHVEVAEIDAVNILQASLLAMGRAVALLAPPCHVLVDGDRAPEALPCPATALVRGDARALSIAAASIVAKVARDALMVDLAQQYPGYGWERNAGYATKMHLAALRALGPTPQHRRSFAPVRNILWQDRSPSA